MNHFGYQGMKSRMELAAIPFNENGHKGQKKSTDGKHCFNIKFPKSRRGQYVVVPVQNACTYGYADNITRQVVKLVESGQTFTLDEDPPSLCAQYERPASKDQAIAEHHAHARLRQSNTK
ncbi:uncharacterized protein LOC135494443 [Lineus longissimus]|uniref:uncharacterized protein LOC135494443 n=1 Tax=Lineus longissimus TaxID=88925 RepID=UPI00315CC467